MTQTSTTSVYTARVTVTGGRQGSATSDDGVLDLALAAPTQMGGPGGATNPEQLFAAGYAACFQSAMGLAARKAGVDLGRSTVTAEVGIGRDDQGYGLSVRLEVAVPGAELEQVQQIAEAAHQVCPYSRATRGNVPVTVIAVPA
jgi:lipoyl-dependent peroxiredoxin